MRYCVDIFKPLNRDKKNLFVRSPFFNSRDDAKKWIEELDYVDDELYITIEEYSVEGFIQQTVISRDEEA